MYVRDRGKTCDLRLKPFDGVLFTYCSKCCLPIPLLYYVVVVVVVRWQGLDEALFFAMGKSVGRHVWTRRRASLLKVWPWISHESSRYYAAVCSYAAVSRLLVMQVLRVATTGLALARCISRVKFVGGYCRVRASTYIATRAGVYTQTGGCIGHAHHACRHAVPCSAWIDGQGVCMYVCVLFCVCVARTLVTRGEVRGLHVYLVAAASYGVVHLFFCFLTSYL